MRFYPHSVGLFNREPTAGHIKYGSIPTTWGLPRLYAFDSMELRVPSPLCGDLRQMTKFSYLMEFYPHYVGILKNIKKPSKNERFVLSLLCRDYYLSIYVMMFLKIIILSPPRGDYILRIGRNSAYKSSIPTTWGSFHVVEPSL